MVGCSAANSLCIASGARNTCLYGNRSHTNQYLYHGISTAHRHPGG